VLQIVLLIVYQAGGASMHEESNVFQVSLKLRLT
jgi:hypothetical protein